MTITETSTEFWEQHYAKMTRPSGGKPSSAVVRFTKDRTPGRALDLGCARGDDVIWLATQGWHTAGVDVAESALTAARIAADQAGVADRTRFERHDLGASFPGGRFDLVTAMFLHTPTEFARTDALKRAADAVATGGLLLIVAHGSRAPWSWAEEGTVFPTAEEELAHIDLNRADWTDVFVGPVERTARGPNGQTAQVIDTVIALERR